MKPERVGARYNHGHPQKYFLSETGRNLILTEYDSSPETVGWLAHELNVPRHVVLKWSAQLEVNRKKERWTQEHDLYLTKVYSYTDIAEIARKTGHSETGVRLRARRLRINKRSEEYTLCSLCLALGCSHDKISRWIKVGWLKATRRSTDMSNDAYYITSAAIYSFIRFHPNEIDLRKVDQLWFLDLVFGSRGLGSFYQPQD